MTIFFTFLKQLSLLGHTTLKYLKIAVRRFLQNLTQLPKIWGISLKFLKSLDLGRFGGFCLVARGCLGLLDLEPVG